MKTAWMEYARGVSNEQPHRGRGEGEIRGWGGMDIVLREEKNVPER